MGYSVTLKIEEEEVYWQDWGSGVGQFLDRAFLGDFKVSDGVSGKMVETHLFWGLNNLVGSEVYLKEKYPELKWKWLTLCEYLFQLWKACKEYPEATLHLDY